MNSTRHSALFLSLALAIGCGESYSEGYGGGYPGGGPGGDYGVTAGGAQDIGYARDIISQGGVPQATDIAIEGLLSEHDIAPLGPACDSLLCARPALAWAPDLATGDMAYWLHLGMTSGLSRSEFVRPPLDVVVAIDKSASMAIDMTETNEAVTRLIDNLREDDRLAVLAFDSQVQLLHELGPVTDRAALKNQVHAIEAGGSWDLERGVGQAYDILREQSNEPGRMRRVMVLSCGYPILDGSGQDPFSQMVSDGARAGVGLSFFGVLLGYNADLADFLGRQMGGAFYYLESLDRVVEVFDTDFDTMVTPLAYNLAIALSLNDSFRMTHLFGVPGAPDQTTSYDSEVTTAFLSNRRGALVARLDRTDAGEIAEVGSLALSYLPEPALGWTAAEEQFADIAVPAVQPDTPYFAGAGARKAVALVNLGRQLQSACASYHRGSRSMAREMLQELAAYLSAEAEAMNDPGLAEEVELVAALIDNMD